MHRNRTAYYTEAAVHLDLEHVAFVDGTLTLYGPSARAALMNPALRQVGRAGATERARERG